MKISHCFFMKRITSFLSGEAVLSKNLMSRHRSFGTLLAIAFLSLSTTVFAGEDASLVRYRQDTESGDIRTAKRTDRKIHNESKRLLRSQQAIDQKTAMSERHADRKRAKKYFQKAESLKPRIKRESSSPSVSARMSRIHRERNMHQGKITTRPVRPIDESIIRVAPKPHPHHPVPHDTGKTEEESKKRFAPKPVIYPDDQEEPVVSQGPLAAPEEHLMLPEKQQEDDISPADSEQSFAEGKIQAVYEPWLYSKGSPFYSEKVDPRVERKPFPFRKEPDLVSEEPEEERVSSSMTEDEKRERLNELEAKLEDKRRALSQIDSSDMYAYQVQGLYHEEEALNKDIAEIEAEIKSLR